MAKEEPKTRKSAIRSRVVIREVSCLHEEEMQVLAERAKRGGPPRLRSSGGHVGSSGIADNIDL